MTARSFALVLAITSTTGFEASGQVEVRQGVSEPVAAVDKAKEFHSPAVLDITFQDFADVEIGDRWKSPPIDPFFCDGVGVTSVEILKTRDLEDQVEVRIFVTFMVREGQDMAVDLEFSLVSAQRTAAVGRLRNSPLDEGEENHDDVWASISREDYDAFFVSGDIPKLRIRITARPR